MSYKPSDVGLPKYLDDWAGDQHILPRIAISGYTDPSPSGVPTYTRYRTYSAQGNLSHFRGKHSFKMGADLREHFRTGGGGGNTSGYFRFDNRYTRKWSDTALYTPGTIGLSWADFMMGLNYDSQITAGNASYATFSPYYGGFFQDQYRVTRKLTLNLGIRLEWEGGPTERYNRMIGWFDKDAKLVITDVAEAAYRANPTVRRTAARSIQCARRRDLPRQGRRPAQLLAEPVDADAPVRLRLRPQPAHGYPRRRGRLLRYPQRH